MEEADKLKKRIKRQAEKNIEIDDSDIPIHEKLVREEHIKEIKKHKRKLT